jgi:NADH dehydrogenase FAD-containing subunit
VIVGGCAGGLAQARANHFKFRLGRFSFLDRVGKTIDLATSHDEAGREITPVQTLGYDTLVMAVGSLSQKGLNNSIQGKAGYPDVCRSTPCRHQLA